MTPAMRAILLAPRAKPPGEILSLFAAGEQGGIWLPTFTKSMFQDAAASVPAVVGMPVVKMLDLSGNGNHITFANVTLQQDAAGRKYLSANGTSSSGATGSINMSGTSNVNVFMGMTKTSDATQAVALEFSATSSTNVGSFAIFSPLTPASTDLVFRGGSTSAPGQNATKTGVAAPYTTVLTGISNVGQTVELRLNGASAALGAGNSAGAFGNYPLYFFARNSASLFASMRFYGSVIRGAACTATQIATVEAYINKLTGAF